MNATTQQMTLDEAIKTIKRYAQNRTEVMNAQTVDKVANDRLIDAAPALLVAAENLLEKIGFVTGIEPERRALIAAISIVRGSP